MKAIKSHLEKIQCPKCGLKQMAEVERKISMDIRLHKCSNKTCRYLITDNEWHKTK